jgi:TonB family protein
LTLPIPAHQVTYLDSHRKLTHTAAKLQHAPLRLPLENRQSINREQAVVVPESDPVSSGKVTSGMNSHDSGKEIAFHRTANREEILLLSTLRNLVSSGEHRLDPVLAAIADGARRLTGASGAAIAMWKEGAMVCRARSGELAPPLGAQLSIDAGISGECLRTGKMQHCPDTDNSPLVDAEVCRSLGLRSIAVLPIPGWRGANGILEVFSTEREAFTQHHLALLEQLTVLAERVRALQPHGATAVAAKEPVEKPRPAGLLPASDRVGDVALAFVERRRRPLVVGAIGAAAILLVAFVIWLGWRGPGESSRDAHAATSPMEAAGVTVHPAPPHLPDDDPVWKPDPGGEVIISLGGSRQLPRSPARFASKVDLMEGKKGSEAQPLMKDNATNVAVPKAAPVSDAGSDSNAAGLAAAESPSTVSPAITAEPVNSSTLNGVLEAKATPPTLVAPISQGISGGRLLRRVTPVYPDQAQTQRVQGRVVLEAMVLEDGTVGNLRIVQGQPMLAQAAVDAVKTWRYQPFVLDGKPIQRETTITIDFKLAPKTR